MNNLGLIVLNAFRPVKTGSNEMLCMEVKNLKSLMKISNESRFGLSDWHITVSQKNDAKVKRPIHAIQISGNKSIQSINNYSHVLEQQQKLCVCPIFWAESNALSMWNKMTNS